MTRLRPVSEDSPLLLGAMQRRSVLAAAAALLLTLWLHLLPALFAALGAFMLYRWIRAKMRNHLPAALQSRPMTVLLTVLAAALIGLAISEGVELLLSASSGGLAKLLQLLADTLDQVRATAPSWLVDRLPDSAAAM